MRRVSLVVCAPTHLVCAPTHRPSQVDPSYTHGYHLRGLLYYGCGEIRLALADFRRGVELDPSDRNCQLMKAVCLNTLGVLSEVIPLLLRDLLLRDSTPPPLPPPPPLVLSGHAASLTPY